MVDKDILNIKVNINPLSVNKCWMGRRFKTPIYKKWILEMEHKLRKAGKMPDSKDWLTVEIDFYVKNISMADTDNPVKPLLDSLTHNGIIKDDRYIKRHIVEKFKVDTKEDEKIEVRLYKYV